MALLYTPSGELGSLCPEFSLPSVDGKRYTRSNFDDARALVVMFICNHCPYVQAIEGRLIELAHEYHQKGVAFIGICANDPTDYPEDTPANLYKTWLEKAYRFPYLIDETQEVTKLFGAVCTPDLYVYDGNHRLAYRGRLDDAWKNPENVKRRELKEALDQLLTGKSVPAEQNPSMGCSIKWKNGD